MYELILIGAGIGIGYVWLSPNRRAKVIEAIKDKDKPDQNTQERPSKTSTKEN